MKISELIWQLERTKANHGDIEVTCTHSLLGDSKNTALPDVFEAIIENIEVHDHPNIGKCVRVWL